MPFRLSATLASTVATVSIAAHQNDDLANEDKPRNDGIGDVVRGVTYPEIPEILTEVLSFLPPFEWAGLRRVDSTFYACLGTTVRNHFKQYGIPIVPRLKTIVCNEEREMEDVWESVMDQPGFRGAIFNGDECILINHPQRVRDGCSESERVRITGMADIDEECYFCQSKCSDIFLYRMDKLHARNIRTGQDITVDWMTCDEKPMIANEKQLVIVSYYGIKMYELDWQSNTAKCVLREKKTKLDPSESQLLTDESGQISSVFCPIGNGCSYFDIESKKWKLIQEIDDVNDPYHLHRLKSSPDAKIIFKQRHRMDTEITTGKTTLLNIPGNSYIDPSPDSHFVKLRILSKNCVMDLRSSEITVIPDLPQFASWAWISDTLFQVRFQDASTFLRCVHNPCANQVTLKADYSLIHQLQVDDELDAGDLFYYAVRIGPNMYSLKRRVIQVQWMDKHDH